MTLDPWKATTIGLTLALALAVGSQRTQSAIAQTKAAPAASDKADDPPAARAGKVLDKARDTLKKAQRDNEGHRDKALKQIDTAITEAKAMSTGPEEKQP